MKAPLIMLVLMTAPYLAARLLETATRRRLDPRPGAAVGLGLLFAFTALGHFVETEGMVRMLPAWLPGRSPLVLATGALELAVAVAFFVPRTRRVAGWTAAALLVLFLPVNVYAAVIEAPMGGHAWGPVYLLLRVPLQALILFWVYRYTLRRKPRVVAETATARAA